MTVQIRQAGVDDAQAITKLFQNGTGRLLDPSRLLLRLQQYPALIAEAGNKIVGFALSSRFAPDILELDNIYIAGDFRNQKIGGDILVAFERAAVHYPANAIIVLNSNLYENAEGKRSASSFYLKNGYDPAFETPYTKVFYKHLLRPSLKAEGR